jgi:hypothetical protein
MSRVCVRIDLERLRRRISGRQIPELSDKELHRWLNDHGFRLDGDWVCDGEEMLAALQEDEVIQKTSSHTVDGVTFSSTVRYR